MHHHWTEFLPEAGRQAASMGRKQMYKATEILETKQRLRELELKYSDEEKNIVEVLSRDWTQDEITLAIEEMNLVNKKLAE